MEEFKDIIRLAEEVFEVYARLGIPQSPSSSWAPTPYFPKLKM